MRIVAIEPLGVPSERLCELGRQVLGEGHEFIFHQDRAEDFAELVKRAREAEALIAIEQPLSSKLLETCPNIRMVSLATGNFEQVDIEKARQKVIPVFTSSGYATYSVGELTIALMLGLYRNLCECDRQARREDVSLSPGRGLFGKTVGIIGTGDVGLHVARVLRSLGCNVLAYSRTRKEEAEVWAGINYVELDELLKQSDCVTMHAAVSDETRMMIGERELALMKRDALFINTASSELVDEKALAKSLREGEIGGAGVSSFSPEEPLSKKHPLYRTPNTMLVPEEGAWTVDSLENRALAAFRNIADWLGGKPGNTPAH